MKGRGAAGGTLTNPAYVHLASRASSISAGTHHGVLHSRAPVGRAGTGGIVHGRQVSLLKSLGQLSVS